MYTALQWLRQNMNKILNSQKTPQYLALTDELWGIYWEDSGENWSCYNVISLQLFHYCCYMMVHFHFNLERRENLIIIITVISLSVNTQNWPDISKELIRHSEWHHPGPKGDTVSCMTIKTIKRMCFNFTVSTVSADGLASLGKH